MDVHSELSDRSISRAIGEELRLARESRGWSRAQLVARLPSGIGERTLLSYEHGTRQLTVLRLLELCRGLSVTASILLSQALQRARILLENSALRVDLHALLGDKSDQFRPMCQWARNKLNKNPDGIAELTPVAVCELADFLGCTHHELAAFLARFIPQTGGDCHDA